jgi:Lon protease-like protein
MDELGLFPLELVLLTTERIPLHIFEPRYRELIQECLDAAAPFGLLLSRPDGLAEVGTRALVAQVLQVLPDGRMNVVVEGRERFRLVELTEGRSFRTARVEPYEEEDDLPEPAEAERALALFRRIAEVTETPVDEPAVDSPLLSFELAARIDFGNDLKQELLELRSPRERLARVAELIERVVEVAERERGITERASRNGKVQPPESL